MTAIMVRFRKIILFFLYLECPPKYDGNCLKNGTEVLRSLSYNTHASDVWFDYIGLFVLGLILHIFAYIGIRRNITSVGYY